MTLAQITSTQAERQYSVEAHEAVISINPNADALFLDVDGTLVDIQAMPDAVVAPADLLDTLSGLLRRFNGAVAIVSGRHIREIDRILAPLALPAAGVHGIQLRFEYGGVIETMAPKLPAKLLVAIKARMGDLDGIVVEPKDEAVAIHYRLAPQHRSTVECILRDLVGCYGSQLEVSQGRMVFEVVPRSCSKGQALRRLSGAAPYKGRRPVMIGDDAPDVSAMQAARDLKGFGLTVGGEFFRRDRADFRGPAAVRAWLRELAETDR